MEIPYDLAVLLHVSSRNTLNARTHQTHEFQGPCSVIHNAQKVETAQKSNRGTDKQKYGLFIHLNVLHTYVQPSKGRNPAMRLRGSAWRSLPYVK